MITKPIRFIQIAVNSDHIYGLSEEGDVYYRDKPPYSYGTTSYANNYQKKEEAEEKKVWKKILMEYKVEIPKGGEVREAQPANEPETTPAETVVDLPARKIYKDADTVRKVQGALQGRGFYKKTNKLDGELGQFTVNAIKEFQKSVNLIETGEVDLALCNSLGLNQPQENETVELGVDDIVVIDDKAGNVVVP